MWPISVCYWLKYTSSHHTEWQILNKVILENCNFILIVFLVFFVELYLLSAFRSFPLWMSPHHDRCLAGRMHFLVNQNANSAPIKAQGPLLNNCLLLLTSTHWSWFVKLDGFFRVRRGLCSMVFEELRTVSQWSKATGFSYFVSL